MNITEFLLARIAEDGHAARAWKGGRWEVGVEETGDGENAYYVVREPGSDHWVADVDAGYGAARHITLHDPVRVLAECAAKRRIVEMHREGPGGGYCSRCDREPVWPCITLRALASVYADHRDYDLAWRDADD